MATIKQTWILLGIVLVHLSLFPTINCQKPSASEEDDFAEFDNFEEDSVEAIDKPIAADSPAPKPVEQPKPQEPPVKKAIQEDDDDELDNGNIEIEEESEEELPIKEKSQNAQKTLSQVNVPDYLQRKWRSYVFEVMLMSFLTLYFVIYVYGFSKNQKLVNAWLDAHKDLLEANFSLVGDDGKQEITNHGFIKETGNTFNLWCSGRTLVEGMLVEVQLIKRQDLFSLLFNLVKPSADKISFQLTLNQDSMDNFVFCIANRKTAARFYKEMNDIIRFCPERKNAEKYGLIGENYTLMSEIGEAASYILDNKIVSLLNKNEDLIDYIHISDQYSGLRNPEEGQSVTRLPQTKKVLYTGFTFAIKDFSNLEDEMERMKPMLLVIFYLLDRLKRFRLSRESKLKSEKNRQKLEKLFLQSTHLQRQELAQIKREERRRQEKEKILAETDPDKQRKWEEKEYKREMKRKTPKMKQLKVKTM